MTYRASSPAGLLSTIPVNLGKYPANSIVAMTIEGNRLGATLRLDTPAVMTGQYLDTFTSYLAKATPERVVLAMFADNEDGITMLPTLADYLMVHLPLTVEFMALVTPEYWLDYDEPTAQRPALEITANPTFIEMVANGDDQINAFTLPTVAPDAVFKRDVAEHYGEWVLAAPVIYETWNMYLAGVGTPTRAEAIDLMAAMESGGGIRDGLLCRVFLEEVGEDDFGPVLLGTHPAPFDKARFTRGIELLTHLASLDAPAPARASVLAGLGWLYWHAGRGSHAASCLDAALEADPDHRLAYLLHEVVVTRGKLSPIAANRANWITK